MCQVSDVVANQADRPKAEDFKGQGHYEIRERREKVKRRCCVERDDILLGNEVSLLWEWLPATIIAARRGGLPQKKINFIGSPTFRLRRIALHQLEHERFANRAL